MEGFLNVRANRRSAAVSGRQGAGAAQAGPEAAAASPPVPARSPRVGPEGNRALASGAGGLGRVDLSQPILVASIGGLSLLAACYQARPGFSDMPDNSLSCWQGVSKKVFY